MVSSTFYGGAKELGGKLSMIEKFEDLADIVNELDG
jgi:hypothetical protein